MRTIKRALDPDNRMNPGKMIDSRSRPRSAMRYMQIRVRDPALAFAAARASPGPARGGDAPRASELSDDLGAGGPA